MATAPPSPSAQPRAFSPRRRAALRLGEMNRLARFRRQCGFGLGDPRRWVELVCHVIAVQRSGDLDYPRLREQMNLLGIPFEDEVGAMRAIHRACDRLASGDRRGIGAGLAGRMLGVTAFERLACSLRTFAAVDATLLEWQQLKRDEKRARDRIRQAHKRAQAGTVSRAEYLDAMAATLKPWEAEGVSRRTWYRRRGTRSVGTGLLRTPEPRCSGLPLARAGPRIFPAAAANSVGASARSVGPRPDLV